MNRAYSILDVKSVDAERRTFSGIATSPTPDRMGDIVEPFGVQFANPLPLLLHHDKTMPVGFVNFGQPTSAGIPFEASIPDVAEAGTLKNRVDEAWQSVKYKIIRGVSIGFRAFDDAVKQLKSGGLHFLKTEVLELSLVVVPAQQEATIHTIKALDTGLAVSGNESGPESRSSAAVVAPVVRGAQKGARAMANTIADQISAFEASRQAKSARMTELMTKAGEEGVTLDPEQEQEYDDLEVEVKKLDAHLTRLSHMEALNKAAAKPVAGTTPEKAAATRGSNVISVKSNLPPGIGMARFVMCSIVAHKNHMSVMDIAKARYPDYAELQSYIMKAAVPAGTTTDLNWASALAEPTISSDFVEWLRPQTIVGKFGTNGIPALNATPFNVKVKKQTSGATAYWVGQGKPKPLTSFSFGSDTLLYTKIATIAVITQELARFSTPSAEAQVRDELRKAVVERMDIDFIDPAQAAVAGVNPASITNGLTPLSSAGTSADNVRTDLLNLLSTYVEGNTDPTGLVLIMPTTLALALSLMVNTLGQREFPDLTMRGGTLNGIPVIPSQYAANASGSGNLVIAVNAPEIYLADDGQVAIDASGEASLEMLDNPTNNSTTPTATSMVSMFQTDSVAIRAERFINWAKRRSDAVVFMDDVNWGSVGSPS